VNPEELRLSLNSVMESNPTKTVGQVEVEIWSQHGERATITRMQVDLNSDLGESFGAWPMGQDEALMASISSANVACGFHAGDPSVMRQTVRLAIKHGVAIGAHPGFPDLVGFGRRELQASPTEVEDLVLYQLAALAGVAAAERTGLQHVKPHGALYNQACRDRALADAIARAVASFDRQLILFGLPGSELLRAAERAGLKGAAEVFADRAYEPDGSLASRRKLGSVIHDEEQVVERAVRMVRDRLVTATDGSDVRLDVDTICLHGDTPGAADLAYKVRQRLAAASIRVVAFTTKS
jgi:5-oxoprolinase (ATP-hydrolysing) subunit A